MVITIKLGLLVILGYCANHWTMVVLLLRYLLV